MDNLNEVNLNNCLTAYYQKHTKGNFYPVYYGIEVSRYCNFACIMCPHPQYKANEKGNMSLHLFSKIIDEIAPYAQIIKLHWIGEPLLNKNIVEMIRYARKKTRAQLFMSTNASILHGELAEEIRTSGLDKIIFSLDGNSKDTFESIRLNSNFEDVLTNVHNFVEAVEQNGGPYCEVKIIQFDANKEEIEEFKKRWSTYKKTIVHTMWLSTWAGQLPRLNVLSGNLSPYASQHREMCADLWFKMQIDWSGQVAICCWDWSGTISLGNILSSTIRDIWQNDLIAKERANHIHQKYLGICTKCQEWAKVNEYEFWYSYDQLKDDAALIWTQTVENDNLQQLTNGIK